MTLILWNTAARASDAELCRNLLAFIVEKHGALGPEELRAFAGAPTGTSPVDFASFPNEPTRLPFVQAFRGFLDGPNGKDVAQALRAEALRLADTKSAEEQRRGAVRDDTAILPVPVLVHKLDAEIGTPTFFTRDGKTFAAFGSGKGDLSILDLETFAETKFGVGIGPVRDAPHPFDHEGKDQLGIVGGNPALVGSPGLNIYGVDGEPAPLLPAEATRSSAGPLPVVIDGKLWLAANERPDNHLILVPVGQPGNGVVRYTYLRGPEDFRMSTYSGPDGPLVVVNKRLGVGWELVDPAAGKSSPIPESLDSFVALHSHGGKARLFIAGRNGAFTRDPRGGPSEPIPDAPTNISVHNALLVDGGTKALVRSSITGSPGTHNVHLIDLEKRTSRPTITVPHDVYALNYFRHAGHEYVVWAETDGTLKMIDLQKPGDVIQRKLVSTMPLEIVPYPTAHGVSAFVRSGSDSPGYVVQLVGRPRP